MAIAEMDIDAERWPDLAAMELWTAWVARLMAHAAMGAADDTIRRTLQGAAEDAQSLREGLGAAATGWLEPAQTAVLCSIYELWDANHDRFERLAAVANPAWHRVWHGRSASARLRPLSAA